MGPLPIRRNVKPTRETGDQRPQNPENSMIVRQALAPAARTIISQGAQPEQH